MTFRQSRVTIFSYCPPFRFLFVRKLGVNAATAVVIVSSSSPVPRERLPCEGRNGVAWTASLFEQINRWCGVLAVILN